MISKRLEQAENISIQDIGLANAFNMSENEVLELDLFQTKNKLQKYAFKLEYNNIKISQKKANKLNEKFENIMEKLDNVSDIDFLGDYWVDFNNYVED